MNVASWKWPTGPWMVSKTKETPSSVQRREGEEFQKRCKKGRSWRRMKAFSKWLGCPWPLSGVDSGYWYDKTLWSSGEAESDGLT